MTDWADRVARRWTHWYTRGLTADTATRRRAEIASDLHEHAAAMGRGAAQQRNVLGRVLWGIPADLSWRWAARASSHRRRETGAPMKLQRVLIAVGVGLVLFLLWSAAGMLNTDGAGLRYGGPLIVGAVLVVIGLAQRDSAPRRSALLIIIGAAAPAATFYWMAPVFLPGFVVVTALVVFDLRRRRRQPGTAV
jgi:hypothetical protein